MAVKLQVWGQASLSQSQLAPNSSQLPPNSGRLPFSQTQLPEAAASGNSNLGPTQVCRGQWYSNEWSILIAAMLSLRPHRVPDGAGQGMACCSYSLP